MKFKFESFPTLSTARLTLRPLQASDAKEVFFLRSDKAVNLYVDRPTPNSLQDAEDFILKISQGIAEGKHIYWSIGQKENDKMIGSICLWNFSADGTIGEVGYDLNPLFQSKGIMSEALKAVINYGFKSLNLNKIEAFTHRENEASKQLLLKNGYKLITDKKDDYNDNNIVFEIVNNQRN